MAHIPKHLRERTKLKSRKKVSRKPSRSVLIVCEGDRDADYFQFLLKKFSINPKTIDVFVEGGTEVGSAPISVVEFAEEQIQDKIRQSKKSPIVRAYDEVWCVVDVEAPTPHTSLNRAYQKTLKLSEKKNCSFYFCMSNPNIEYWYLLHYDGTTRYFNSNNEVYDALKAKFPSFCSSSKTKEVYLQLFGEIFPNTDKAIKRATRSKIIDSDGVDLRAHNPSTRVHELVNRFKQHFCES